MRLSGLAVCLLLSGLAAAQDPFEIHIYEYEPMLRGQFTLEQHLNYVGSGTKVFDGSVAPTNNQLHMTYEVTAGLGGPFAVGVMELNAIRPGGPGLEYAGWRILPHFYAPASWRLPLKIGLVTEFSFQKTSYEENARRVEVRPILEKSFGKWQLDVNPVFERALHGPGTRQGWNFEPAGRVAYEASKRFTPSVEYYSALGPLPGFFAGSEQIHQFFPGGDFHFGERVTWSVGVGVAATPAGSQLIYKSRVEVAFGRTR